LKNIQVFLLHQPMVSNHNDKFTVDEDVLHRGSALYAQFAYDFLKEKAK